MIIIIIQDNPVTLISTDITEGPVIKIHGVKKLRKLRRADIKKNINKSNEQLIMK